jgi:hypothetical protein
MGGWCFVGEMTWFLPINSEISFLVYPKTKKARVNGHF